MIDEKHLSELPHYDLIRENQTVELRSIFDFKGGNEELFPFLYGCQKKNCTVVFKNENITVKPKNDENKTAQSIQLSLYALIAKEPKIVEEYIRYLMLCKKQERTS
jgi:hypothetical protein